MKSNCCHGEVNTVFGNRVYPVAVAQGIGVPNGTTAFYQCDKCKKACDILNEADYKYCGE